MSPRLSATERRIGGGFGLSALAALGLAVVYLRGGQPQLEGALLAVALGGLGVGIVAWTDALLPHEPVAEDRHDPASTEGEREAFEQAFERGEEVVARRGFLLTMLGAAVGALGVSALFPIRSLGPKPGRSLSVTSWRRGARAVTADGKLVKVGDLEVGSVLTVFPEGHTDAADSQTLLIKVADGTLEPVPGREDWTPENLVAYSKICTHAGCPVGLYEEQLGQLLCPCHQSTFDVLDGARPVFGPAGRPLPQLPLSVDGEGYVVAEGDFDEPVGPGYWNRG